LNEAETRKNIETPGITVENFFDLLIGELKLNPGLRGYYRFINSESQFHFRKAYFIQRLQYIADHVTDKSASIWDCGSGYGTTCLFLSLNGFKTFGSTLEYYFKEIPNRKEYWSQFGNIDLFVTNYENIYDSHPDESSIDVIILQDTLHHLEPLQKALAIFNQVLKPDGKIILVEENGSNLVQNLKLLVKRGNRRIIDYYDENLKKQVIMGNENIRGYHSWEKELSKQNFRIIHSQTSYVRLFPALFFTQGNAGNIVKKEQKIWKSNPFLKKYFYFGINMIIEKQK
jgi:SAM-dependent methyltransferase